MKQNGKEREERRYKRVGRLKDVVFHASIT
jgi:hypothetical protein